ncbi:MAG: hypothetical protein O6941_08445 [Planctomycetota bacterium]|nr:hypothetical protein [Planctomycetota bacterium]
MLAIALAPLLTALLLWLATPSWFIILLAKPQLTRNLGGEVGIGAASYLGNGTLVFEDLTLRTRTHEGPAAQVLGIDRVVVIVDMSTILHDRIHIKDVLLEGVLLRLSEDAQTPGVFNFSALDPQWSLDREKDLPFLAPSVRIDSAIIEMGTHDGGKYVRTGLRRVTGKMYPAADRGKWYRFELTELAEDGVNLGQTGVSISGTWNVETLEHRAQIDGLVLDERTLGMCPQIARLWWQRMQPQGRLASAVVQWRRGQPFSAELAIDRVALTIPIATDDFWTSYKQGRVEAAASRPRMRVHSGTIKLRGDELSLDELIGELGSSGTSQQSVGVPYRVNLSIHDLPKFDWEHQQEWMEQVLATAPFEMSLVMDDFSLAPSTDSDAPAVDLPRQVAETLARFNLTGWSLSMDVQISRSEPTVGDGGHLIPQPIRTTGEATIREASGAFQAFPYPLENVSACVEFDSDQVTILELTGQGSSNSTIKMSGWIAPPSGEAAVSLRLFASDIPLDARFREALKGGERTTFDAMLHRPSYEALAEAGLLPDDNAIADARRTKQRKTNDLRRLREDLSSPEAVSRRQSLEREIDQLETLIAAGPFELGGRVDLDLTIQRPRGPDQRTEITGTVTVHEAGVVYERFPYPIYVRGGILSLENEQIVIVSGEQGEGIPIVTPGGGRGMVTGEIRLHRTERGTYAEPDLAIDLSGDSLGELLYAAMPVTEAERADLDQAAVQLGTRRSRIARFLADAGLSGFMNYAGTITADPAGQTTYDFTVEFFDGALQPSGKLPTASRGFGLPWPKGCSLDAVEALIRIRPDAIQLVDFAGNRGDGRITAVGQADLTTDPPEMNLTMHFNDVAFERYLVDLVPDEGAQRVATLWQRYQPGGTYHAKLQYHALGSESQEVQLVVWPEELSLLIDGERVWLIRERGEIVVRADQVTFDDLTMRVRDADRDDGIIVLDGHYGPSDDSADIRMRGSWAAAQFASPLITEALNLIGAAGQADRYRRYRPQGAFDAEFSYESPRGDQPQRYEFTVRPDTLSLRVDDTPVFANFDQGAEVTLAPGLVTLRNVAGRHAGGTFHLDGAVQTEGPLEADLQLDYLGRLDSPQVLAFLPASLRSALDSLKIGAAESVHLGDAELHIAEVEPGETGGRWHTTLAGRLETRGASLDAGVKISELDGVFDLHAEYQPGVGTSLDILARADHARANGRELTNIEARISLGSDGRVVSIREFRADMYGGVVTLQASVGLDSGSEYQAAIDLVGVSLEGIVVRDEPTPREPESAPSGGDPPTGELYASLRVAGQRGHPETRRGRGAIRVIHGRMISMPLTLRILQLVELMPPFSGSLDFADLEFYVQRDRIVFERLFLECPTLELVGEGSMSYPGMELDVRFRTRGTVPVIRDLIGGLSDQLFVVEVTGPLGDPQARLIPLPGVRQGKTPQRSVTIAQRVEAE